MAKGYWIAHIDVVTIITATRLTSPPNPAIFRKFGGRFLVRGGPFEAAGRRRAAPARWFIEFPDYAPRPSPVSFARIRQRITKTGCRPPTAIIIVAEGYDPPSPDIGRGSISHRAGPCYHRLI